MNDERSDDLSARERAAYESLAKPVAPPAECEARIVDELRARDLVQSSPLAEPAADARSTGPRTISFGQRLVSLVPRVSLAAAALAATFYLGIQVGRRADVVESPVAPAEAYYDVEKGDEGDVFKNSDGEMVASVRGVPLGFHPGRPLVLGANEKPPIDRNDDLAYGNYPLYPLDGSMRSVSLRVP